MKKRISSECLEELSESVENKHHFFELSADIVEIVDPVFYKDPVTVAYKELELD